MKLTDEVKQKIQDLCNEITPKMKTEEINLSYLEGYEELTKEQVEKLYEVGFITRSCNGNVYFRNIYDLSYSDGFWHNEIYNVKIKNTIICEVLDKEKNEQIRILKQELNDILTK